MTGLPDARPRPFEAAIVEFAERNARTLLAATCLILGLGAWVNRFVQDDAFILLVYARHLVEGRGLVWLPGERVEGYTTFLWTLVLAIPNALRLDPIAFVYGAGLLVFEATLLATYALARDVFGSRPVALLALWVLGTNYSFSAYATGGLETQLQACFVVVSLWFSRRVGGGRGGPGTLAALSLAAAGALLTRLDSALLLVVPLAASLDAVLRGRSATNRAAALACLVLPAAALLGAWFAWKVPFYGDLLPNTFYAKASAISSYRRGVRYVLLFAREYALWPFAIAVLFAARTLLRDARTTIVQFASVALWIAYIVKVGGDFMEFRMFVPVLPILAVWIAGVLAELRPRVVAAALAAGLVASSAVHRLTYGFEIEMESVPMLHAYVADPDIGWIGVGRVLGREFGEVRDSVLFATTAAGAIPFYSGLPTLDMHGLMDRWIARHGAVRDSKKPGHQRFAPLGYLERRGVNFVLGHPHLFPLEPEMKRFPLESFLALDSADVVRPAQARLVEVPIGRGHALTLLYLTRTPALDALVARRGWRVSEPSDH